MLTISKNEIEKAFNIKIHAGIQCMGVDTARDTVEFAKLIGVVKTRGSYYYYEDDRLGHGLNNTLEELGKNPEVLDKIKEMCYNVIVNKTAMVSVDDDEDIVADLLD